MVGHNTRIICTKHIDNDEYIVQENLVCIYVGYETLYQAFTVYSPLSQHMGFCFMAKTGCKRGVFVYGFIRQKYLKSFYFN